MKRSLLTVVGYVAVYFVVGFVMRQIMRQILAPTIGADKMQAASSAGMIALYALAITVGIYYWRSRRGRAAQKMRRTEEARRAAQASRRVSKL